jgi:hypothetical protein
MINGKLCLISDIDMVIIVRTKGLIRGLINVKRLSKITTTSLKKLGFRSHVSLSIMTEDSLGTADPSIFMFDLMHNGKIIYKNIDGELVLPKFSINDIPVSDIYRLLFNRMIEALESFIFDCVYTSFDETRIPTVLNRIEKLILSIIQSILLKQKKLILHSKDTLLNELEASQTSRQDPQLYRSIQMLKKIGALKARTAVKRLEIENIWIQLSDEFRSVVESLGFDHNNELEFDSMFPPNSLTQKIVSCILLLLQYYRVSSLSDLTKTIIFERKFGSDHVYFIMYGLFLSSKKFTSSLGIESNQLNLDSTFLNSEEWFRLFNSYLIIWKHKTGA